MKTVNEVLEYLKFEGDNLHNLIGNDKSEFNNGRLYVMDKIIKSVEELIKIERIEYKNIKKNCSHNRLEKWNHGYHNECLDCGATDV